MDCIVAAIGKLKANARIVQYSKENTDTIKTLNIHWPIDQSIKAHVATEEETQAAMACKTDIEDKESRFES